MPNWQCNCWNSADFIAKGRGEIYALLVASPVPVCVWSQAELLPQAKGVMVPAIKNTVSFQKRQAGEPEKDLMKNQPSCNFLTDIMS